MDGKIVLLIKSLFACDKDGNHSIRVVVDSAESGDLTNAVESHSTRSLSTLVESAIVLDGDGNPALKLSAVNFGMTLEDGDIAKRKAKVEVLEKANAKKETDRKKRLAKAKK